MPQEFLRMGRGIAGSTVGIVTMPVAASWRGVFLDHHPTMQYRPMYWRRMLDMVRKRGTHGSPLGSIKFLLISSLCWTISFSDGKSQLFSNLCHLWTVVCYSQGFPSRGNDIFNLLKSYCAVWTVPKYFWAWYFRAVSSPAILQGSSSRDLDHHLAYSFLTGFLVTTICSKMRFLRKVAFLFKESLSPLYFRFPLQVIC